VGIKPETSMATVPLTSSTYPKMNFSFPDGSEVERAALREECQKDLKEKFANKP